MARETQSDGSTRSGASSSNNSEITSKVGDCLQEITGHDLPTRSQLVTMLTHMYMVSEDRADSWVTTALMSGRIHETDDGKMRLIQW